ncbi:hypothetical protein ACEUZ9_002774 [Paracoccus litorisediminis]|uniref:hypothetical protein n=1 Tax=Paracoccus litorisediminis TaxID=2006130 RepID=UPI0037307C40
MTNENLPRERFPADEALKRFKAFDAAVEAEMVKGAPKSPEELVKRLRALIDMLPQRPAIQDQHAQRWLERVIPMATARMQLEHGKGKETLANIFDHCFWHVRRASGIGGSEASTVVKHYRGKRGTWGDAHSLVKEKLLILSPTNSTTEMSRGVRAEPWIQRMSHEKNGEESDLEALKKLRGFRWDMRPAGIGTPDDITRNVEEAKAGIIRRRLKDYKAPSANVMEEYDSKGISFDYVCQDHHYFVIALAAGIKIDDMSIEALDPRGFEIATFDVPYDKALAREISVGIDNLWFENVMLGLIPEAPRAEELPIKDQALVELGVQMAYLKVLEDDVKARRSDINNRIAAVSADWHEIATGKLDLSVGAWSRDRSWDEQGLIDIAESAGVPTEEFYHSAKKPAVDTDRAIGVMRELHQALLKDDHHEVEALLAELRQDGLPVEKKLDVAKLAERLEGEGHSLVTAARVKESFRLSTKKSGPEFERLAALRAQISELGEGLETMFAEKAPGLISDAREEVDEEELSDNDLGL